MLIDDDDDFLGDDPDFGGDIDDVDQGSEDGDDFFDLDSYASQKVRIKVDGEDVVVSLSELTNGYSRHADYTRKTQELARQRSELQTVAAIKQALDNDPIGTLKVLSDFYGADTPPGKGTQQAPVSRSADPWDDDFDDDPSPQEDPRIAAYEQRLARIEAKERQQLVEAQLQALSLAHDDFDPEAVLSTAIRLGIDDLEAAYAVESYGRKRQAGQREEQRTTAKRDAQVVSGGRSARGSQREDVGEIRTVRDAWNAAKREAGVA